MSKRKFGDTILLIGVLTEIVGGVVYFIKAVPKNSPLIPFLGVFGLILIGAGSSIKKKNTK